MTGQNVGYHVRLYFSTVPLGAHETHRVHIRIKSPSRSPCIGGTASKPADKIDIQQTSVSGVSGEMEVRQLIQVQPRNNRRPDADTPKGLNCVMQGGGMMDLLGGDVGQANSRLEGRGLLNYAWWLSCARTAGRLRQAAPGARHMHAARASGLSDQRGAVSSAIRIPIPRTVRQCAGQCHVGRARVTPPPAKGGKVQTCSKDEGCSDAK